LQVFKASCNGWVISP
jgi:hypothetical protein